MMRRDTWLCLALGVLVLTGWETWVQLQQTSPLVLPAPSVVALTLWNGLVNGYLWPHIGHTLYEVLLGLMLGGGLGFIGGIVLGESQQARRVLMPYVVLSQVVPKLALGPLFIVWFGFGALPTVVMTALICFFPLLENTSTCMQHVDPDRLELFRMLRASAWQTFWRLKMPSGLPHILSGLRVAVVLAWVGAVVAEFIGANQGLGALIIGAQGSMDTPLMFAVLTVITFLGLVFYQLVTWLERWLVSTSTSASASAHLNERKF
jgi:NitT/TauT family transport system permease protein